MGKSTDTDSVLVGGPQGSVVVIAGTDVVAAGPVVVGAVLGAVVVGATVGVVAVDDPVSTDAD
jgi:hypothetical protein